MSTGRTFPRSQKSPMRWEYPRLYPLSEINPRCRCEIVQFRGSSCLKISLSWAEKHRSRNVLNAKLTYRPQSPVRRPTLKWKRVKQNHPACLTSCWDGEPAFSTWNKLQTLSRLYQRWWTWRQSPAGGLKSRPDSRLAPGRVWVGT